MRVSRFLPGAAQGMTQGNAASSGIEKLVIPDTQRLGAVNGLGSEGLVDFPDADVFFLQPRFLKNLGNGHGWADAHISGIHADHHVLDQFHLRFQAEFPAFLLARHENACSGIIGLAGISCRDRCQLVFQENGLQCGEALQRRTGPDALVRSTIILFVPPSGVGTSASMGRISSLNNPFSVASWAWHDFPRPTGPAPAV